MEITKEGFELVTDLKPAGDQPKAIEELLNNLEKGVKEQVLLGATGTGKSLHPEERIIIGERYRGEIRWAIKKIGDFVGELSKKFPVVRNGEDLLVLLPEERYYTITLSPRNFDVEIKPLYGVSFHMEDKLLYEIELEDGRKIKTTGDHNFYVLSEDGFILKKSSELGGNDFVPIPRKFPDIGKKFNNVFLTDFIKPSERIFIIPSSDIYEEFVEKCYGERSGYKLKRAYLCGELGIPFTKCKDFVEAYKDKLHIKTQGGNIFPNRLELDRELLEFIGLYIAEGLSTARYMVISTTDEYYKKLTIRIAEKYNMKVGFRDHKDIVIYSTLFSQFISAMCGSNSESKRLPPFWINLSNEQLSCLLRALFDGDGSVERYFISLTTKSKALTNDLLYALLKLGIWGRVRNVFKKVTNSKHDGNIYFVISIYGEDAEKFVNTIGFNSEEKSKRALSLLNMKRNTNKDIIPYLGDELRNLRLEAGKFQREIKGSLCRQTVSSVELGKRFPSVKTFTRILESFKDNCLYKYANVRWSRIKSVKEVPYSGYVYDLSVKDNETFLAGFGGMFVHNTFTLANVIALYNKPTLVIAHNKILAAQLYREFKELFPNNAVEYFISYYDYYQPEAYIPEKDLYIEKDASINETLERYRHSATISVLERRDVIVVASVSCIYGLGSPEHYQSLRVKVAKGLRFPLSKVVRKLVEIGYERNDYALRRATFSVKGDAIEIVPSHSEDYLVRIELWDDEVDRIVILDTINRHIISEIEEYSFFPASHYIAPRPTVEEALDQIERDLHERVKWFESKNRLVEAKRLYQRTMHDIEMIREIGHCKGIENYSRYFDGREPGEPPFTLLDYFPEDFLLIIDESHVTVPQIRAMYNGDRSRKEKLVEYGWRLPSALDNRPLKFSEFLERINQVIYVSATPSEWEIRRSKGVIVEQIVRPTGLVDPEIEVAPKQGQIERLIKEIKLRKTRNERAIVLTTTKRLAEEVADYLFERGIKTKYLHSDLDAIARAHVVKELREGTIDAVVGVNLLREGLDLPEVSLVAILDADKEGFLRSYTSLIQTIGRAARNVNGKAILFADRITESMKRAIEETERRRKIQQEYNKKHGITPKTIVKPVKELLAIEDLDFVKLPENVPKGIKTEEDVIERINKLEKEMWKCAQKWEFEKAAKLRDEIKRLKELLKLV